MSGGKAVENEFRQDERGFAALLLAAGLCGASSGFAARAESRKSQPPLAMRRTAAMP